MSALTGEIALFLPIVGQADAVLDRFAGDPGVWLPRSRSCGPGRWIVSLGACGALAAVKVAVGPICRTDPPSTTSWRSLSWRAVVDRDALVGHPPLPVLTGEVGLYAKSGHASVVLAGSLDPSAGAGAGPIDAAAATAASFVEAVARSLGEVPAVVCG